MTISMTQISARPRQDLAARQGTRIVELDGLRGIAVIMVLVWHFIGSMSDQKTWISSFLHASTIFGRTGVDLFFVLSGFLIIGILVDYRSSANVKRVFYFRRFLRIYPPYFILIAFYWLGYIFTGESAAFNTDGGLLLQLFAQSTFNWNLLMAVAGGAVAKGFSVTWSVAIEEWFYLLFPWVIFWCPPKSLPWVLSAVAISSWAARVGVYLALPAFPMAPYVLMPLRLDGLCVGGLLALMVRSQKFVYFAEARVKEIAFISFLFVFSLPIIVSLIRHNLDLNMYVWGHAYMSVGFAFVILWVIVTAGDGVSGFLRNRILVHAGLYSYSLYLFHPFFISLFFRISGKEEVVNSVESGAVAASALIAATTLSVIFYWSFEKRLQELGRMSKYAAP